MQIQERARRTPKAAKVGGTKKIGNVGTNGSDSPADTSELDVRKLLRALQAVRDGDFSVRLAMTRSAWPAKSPIPSMKSSLRTSAWRRNSSALGRSSAKTVRPAIGCRSTGAPAPGAPWKRPSTP